MNLMRLLVVSMSFVAACGCADAAGCRKVVLSAHPQQPPLHWLHGERLVGADVELTGQILDELGVTWEVRPLGSFPAVLTAAQRGRLDLILSLTVTPERSEYLQFTETSAFASPVSLFVAQSSALRFETWQDLIGKRGARVAGEPFGSGFDEFAWQNLRLTPANGLEDLFGRLLAGRIDYAVTNLHAGQAHLLAKGLEARVRALPNLVHSGSLHHGFVKRSPCRDLASRFDARLKQMQADGELQVLLERHSAIWRGQHLDQRAERP